MSEDEDEQIEGLKRAFLTTVDVQLRKEVFDTLGTFSDKGIRAINELMLATIDAGLKSHGLEVIRKARSRTDENKSANWQLEGELSADEEE